MINLKRILLPTDFSEPSLEATHYAVEFASRFGAELHLLNVIEDAAVYLPMFEGYPLPSKAEFEQYARTRLENWVLPDDVEKCNPQQHWVHGKPFVEILRFAKEYEIDLVVIGTHGRGMAAHLLLGSVAEKVVRKGFCPVLTVRPGDHHFVHPGEK